jgi:type I restriction enzyme S subunit
MEDSYPIVQIGEVATSISETHRFGKEQLIFLNTSDILHGKFLHRTYSSVKGLPGQAKKSIRKNDILFSEIRPANGRWAYVEDDADDFVVSTKLMVIRAKQDRLLPKFLYHFLTSPKTTNWLQHLADSRSGTFPQITFDQVASLDLPLPPLPEQRGIAAVLGALDEKIQLNRRMNATLEAIARALFQSWFVDFGPIRAKQEGRLPTGLDEPTATLFPAQFQDSEVGEIPHGWQLLSLYDTARFVNGAAFKSTDFCPAGDGLPVIKIVELKDGIGTQTKFSRRELAPDQMIEAGDVLYSWSGSPDTSLDAFIWTAGSGLLNQHIFKVVTSNMAQRRFVYYLLKYLRSDLIEIARNKQTTGLGHVTVADLKRLLVCYPPRAVLAAFDSVVAPLYDRSFANELESRTLANLRDTLLPKLLSGALRASGIHTN